MDSPGGELNSYKSKPIVSRTELFQTRKNIASGSRECPLLQLHSPFQLVVLDGRIVKLPLTHHKL